MTAMNSTMLHQHQLNLIKQNEKYNQGIAEYNLTKVIRAYRDSINAAETSNEAKGLAESLQAILTAFGKTLGDVDGLNTDLINGLQNAAAGGKHGQKGSAYDKAIIKDLSEEYGIDVKKRGTTKDWLALAKKDENVRVLDKNGNDVTNERTGRIRHGDILEVNSKKHGKVQISVGGDGEINGGDDKVISIGGKTAANNMMNGMNQINQQQPKQANQHANHANNNHAAPANNIFANTLLGTENPMELAQNPLMENSGNLFSEKQIKSLIAAMLNQSIYAIEQREYEKYYQNYQAS